MGAASVILGIALQEPLASLFTGVALDVEGVLKRGDWIRVGGEDGVAGKVVDKNWRTTRLLTLQDVLITIPNRALGSEMIMNYHQPDPIHVQRLYVGTSYKDPPIKVKEVLRTILMRDPRIARNPPPSVRTIKYNDFSIDYELRFSIHDYGEHQRIKDSVMSQVWYAFKFYGIEIPFPIRTVHMKEQEHLAKERKEIQEAAVDIEKYLMTLPFLTAHLKPKDFDFLAGNSFQRVYTPGDYVVHRGEMGDALYIVREGCCEVLLSSGECRRIEPGSYFGEMGLLSAAVRTADVVAGHEGCRTIQIDRDCMQILFKKYPALRGEFEAVKERRLEDAGLARERRDVEFVPFLARVSRRVKDFLRPW
jgi:CRP-like cAMP-binding protein